jgi:hypothetical protein
MEHNGYISLGLKNKGKDDEKREKEGREYNNRERERDSMRE